MSFVSFVSSDLSAAPVKSVDDSFPAAFPESMSKLLREVWDKASARGVSTEDLRRELLIVLAHHPSIHSSNTWLPLALAIDALPTYEPSFSAFVSNVSRYASDMGSDLTTTAATRVEPTPTPDEQTHLDPSGHAFAQLVDSLECVSLKPASWEAPPSRVSADGDDTPPRGMLRRSESGMSTASTEGVGVDTENNTTPPPVITPKSHSRLQVPNHGRVRRHSAPHPRSIVQPHLSSETSNPSGNAESKLLLVVTPPSPLSRRHSSPSNENQSKEEYDDEVDRRDVDEEKEEEEVVECLNVRGGLVRAGVLQVPSLMSDCSEFEVLPCLTVSLSHPLDSNKLLIVPHIVEKLTGTELTLQIEGLEMEHDHPLQFSVTVSDSNDHTLHHQGSVCTDSPSISGIDMTRLFNGRVSVCVTLTDAEVTRTLSCECVKATRPHVVAKVVSKGSTITTNGTRAFTATTVTTTPVDLSALQDGGITFVIHTCNLATTISSSSAFQFSALLYKKSNPFGDFSVTAGSVQDVDSRDEKVCVEVHGVSQGIKCRVAVCDETGRVEEAMHLVDDVHGNTFTPEPISVACLDTKHALTITITAHDSVGHTAQTVTTLRYQPLLPVPTLSHVMRTRDGEVRVLVDPITPSFSKQWNVRGVLHLTASESSPLQPVSCQGNEIVFANTPLDSSAQVEVWVNDEDGSKGEVAWFSVEPFHVVTGEVVLGGVRVEHVTQARRKLLRHMVAQVLRGSRDPVQGNVLDVALVSTRAVQGGCAVMIEVSLCCSVHPVANAENMTHLMESQLSTLCRSTRRASLFPSLTNMTSLYWRSCTMTPAYPSLSVTAAMPFRTEAGILNFKIGSHSKTIGVGAVKMGGVVVDGLVGGDCDFSQLMQDDQILLVTFWKSPTAFDVLRIDVAQDLKVGTSIHKLATDRGCVTVAVTWRPPVYHPVPSCVSPSSSSPLCPPPVLADQGVLGYGEWHLSSLIDEGVASMPLCVGDLDLCPRVAADTVALKFPPGGHCDVMTDDDMSRPLVSSSQRHDLFLLTRPMQLKSSKSIRSRYSKVRTIYSKPQAQMEVVVALDTHTNEQVCIKRVSMTESPAVNVAIQKEACLSYMCSPCPHAVTHRGSYRTDHNLWLVMDMVDGCTLQNLVDKVQLPVGFIAYMVRELLRALSWLHARHISHRDLKGENVLLDANSGKVLLVDFGASHVACEGQELCGEFVGTLPFLPPEISILPQLAKEKRSMYHGRAADVWSLGILVHSLFKGEIPHLSKLPKDVRKAAKVVHKASIPSTKGMDPVLASFFKKCVVKDAAKRPTVDELLDHPLMSKACQPEMWMKFVNSRMWD